MKTFYMFSAMIISFLPVFGVLGFCIYLMSTGLNETTLGGFISLVAIIGCFYYLRNQFADVHAWFYINCYYKKEKFTEDGKEYIKKTNLIDISTITHKGKKHYEKGHAVFPENNVFSGKEDLKQYWYNGVKFDSQNLEDFKVDFKKYRMQTSIGAF